MRDGIAMNVCHQPTSDAVGFSAGDPSQMSGTSQVESRQLVTEELCSISCHSASSLALADPSS